MSKLKLIEVDGGDSSNMLCISFVRSNFKGAYIQYPAGSARAESVRLQRKSTVYYIQLLSADSRRIAAKPDLEFVYS
ncbi:hypothetical protein [Sporosarcina sp. Te-1]|uniref:hypothetical protein n=1 Tax=Sporosarcina sp. Te-1 TaxID=2818390 RepID=UPI001A9F29C9|nr:hypothetical protein [Sporosarcina sp. Te-1]QTD40240.1 hypothetical protein J3U78_15710 [Sporosarcina sp. Te-1]